MDSHTFSDEMLPPDQKQPDRDIPGYTYEIVEENDRIPAHFRKVNTGALTIPAHWHDYLEILLILSGSMTAVVQAKTYTLSQGDILIVNSEDLHMTQTHGSQTEYILLQISARRMQEFFPDFHSIRFSTQITADQMEMQKSRKIDTPDHDLLAMLTAYEQKEDGYPLLFTSRLYGLLYVLYRNYSSRNNEIQPSSDTRDTSRITQIMKWIRDSYREPLNLNDAAALLGISREYFCRIFKKYTGQTFLEYLNTVRTMHVYKDMRTSDDTLTNLMEKNGITNYKIFIRTFKKLYGTTPQKARNSYDTKKDIHHPSP